MRLLARVARVSLLVLLSWGAAAQAAGKGVKAPPPPPGPGEMKLQERRVEREGVKLRVVEKWRAGNEENWKQNGKVILLVHGGTWASRCTFDPDPERGYSLMDALADAGYDVFALDLHGYGRSEASPDDASEAQVAWKDIEATVEFVRSFRWVERVHVLGYQWGTHPVMLYAAQKPQRVAKVVLLGGRWKHVEYTGAAPVGPVRTLGQQAALLKPEDGDLDQELVRRRAQVCRAESTQAPNGALRDLAKPSGVDPRLVKAPVLLLQGEKDGSRESVEDRLALYQELGSREKWVVTLKGLGKYALVERGHARLEQALFTFLEMAVPSP